MKISEVMSASGVKFGTSGARGLASALTDRVAYAYDKAFLQYCSTTDQLGEKSLFAIAGDLRPSTPRIMRAALPVLRERGISPVFCGNVPAPAVALFGLEMGIPTKMVTGSHIPVDRNGIKYTTPDGEIKKHDEAGIRNQDIEIDEDLFDAEGSFREDYKFAVTLADARDRYIDRYRAVFPQDFLAGKRVGVYEHSSVARDLLIELYESMGAEVVRLGRSDEFVAVDTESVRDEDYQRAVEWAQEHALDIIVSTDGDADRPLISDERGRWLRGDIVGILVARFLGADVVVTPVSCNSAVERSDMFAKVVRTKIGSPYVIEQMETVVEPDLNVLGYEANGGILLGSDVSVNGAVLRALPTRDAVVAHLAIMALSIQEKCPVSSLVDDLPRRFTASERLAEFPTELSAKIVKGFSESFLSGEPQRIEAALRQVCKGSIRTVDVTDGVRITYGSSDSEDIVHFRPSGNAPEFRCYTESSSEARAQEVLQAALALMESWRHKLPKF